jgi:hypothetical protein
MKLTVFANFNIDSQERLLRMRDSLNSFKNARYISGFIINIRGSLRSEAKEILGEELKNRNVQLWMIESSEGWRYDSQLLLENCETTHVMVWIEDHICLDTAYFDSVVISIEKEGVDYLQYSWWGDRNLREAHKCQLSDCGVIKTFTHDIDAHARMSKQYTTSLVGIYSLLFLRKLLQLDIEKPTWSELTPFNMERPSTDLRVLPFKEGVLKKELFASIDDDKDIRGSSLISRGIYSERGGRISGAFPVQSMRMRIVSRFKRAVRPLKHIAMCTLNLQHTPLKDWQSYIKSVLNPESVRSPNQPWLNYWVIDYICSELQLTGKRVFEYGSGASTLFWRDRGAELVVSVEHSAGFYCKYAEKMDGKVIYVLAEPELVARPMKSAPVCHSSRFRGYDFFKYVNSIGAYDDEYFDFIVIDGRARSACLEASVRKLRPGGTLLFDNCDREEYRGAFRLTEGWSKREFRGTVRGLLELESTVLLTKPL